MIDGWGFRGLRTDASDVTGIRITLEPQSQDNSGFGEGLELM